MRCYGHFLQSMMEMTITAIDVGRTTINRPYYDQRVFNTAVNFTEEPLWPAAAKVISLEKWFYQPRQS